MAQNSSAVMWETQLLQVMAPKTSSKSDLTVEFSCSDDCTVSYENVLFHMTVCFCKL